MNWREEAACLGAATNLWFPNSHQTDVARAAKKVCARCPVRSECLEAHLGDMDGSFGGLSPMDRRKERRRRLAEAS